MFDRFTELQSRIHGLVDRTEALLLDRGAPDIGALGSARWELARTLREYQLFKHSCIFDPLEQRRGADASSARIMKADCIRFGEEFLAYVLRWSAASPLQQWDEFESASRDMIARIRAQLAAERIGVTDLLGSGAPQPRVRLAT
jgi:hypothetical protein